MTTKLFPGDLDVPPTRHAELRAGVLRQAADHRRPGWLIPTVAAATTALLLAGVAAVPAFRHRHATDAVSTRPTGPKMLVVAYQNGSGARPVWNPVSRRYVAVSNYVADVSPDGRWAALTELPTFDYSLVPTGRLSADNRALARKDAVSIPGLGSSSRSQLWAADSSRFYVFLWRTDGLRVQAVDPATHSVVRTVDLRFAGRTMSTSPLAADPRTGFTVISGGTLLEFDPAGRPTRSRPRPSPPAGGGSAQALSPDRRWLSVTELVVGGGYQAAAQDPRTGARIPSQVRGPSPGWYDEDHYLVSTRAGGGVTVYVVEAATGRVTMTRRLPLPTSDLTLAQFIPLTGPPPPGALTF